MLVFISKYYFINNLVFTIGLGSIIGGAITYIPNKNTYKNSNCRKNFEQKYDERFIELSQKSSELAINILFVLIGVSALITLIYPIQAYKLCTILILLVFITKYFCYTYYKHKYEDEDQNQEEIPENKSIGNSTDFTFKKILSLFSIVVVFIGTILCISIGNVYLGSFLMKQIGITNTIYFKIAVLVITLGFLTLGNYSSKTDYTKLNKILRWIFGKMVFLSIILMFLNPFFIRLGILK